MGVYGYGIGAGADATAAALLLLLFLVLLSLRGILEQLLCENLRPPAPTCEFPQRAPTALENAADADAYGRALR